jgi:hypothetical protein
MRAKLSEGQNKNLYTRYVICFDTKELGFKKDFVVLKDYEQNKEIENKELNKEENLELTYIISPNTLIK